MNEGFPLCGVLLDVFLHYLFIDELRGIAVVQIIARIALILTNRRIVQDKVIENAAVKVGHETADQEQDTLSEVEFKVLFMII